METIDNEKLGGWGNLNYNTTADTKKCINFYFSKSMKTL